MEIMDFVVCPYLLIQGLLEYKRHCYYHYLYSGFCYLFLLSDCMFIVFPFCFTLTKTVILYLGDGISLKQMKCCLV